MTEDTTLDLHERARLTPEGRLAHDAETLRRTGHPNDRLDVPAVLSSSAGDAVAVARLRLRGHGSAARIEATCGAWRGEVRLTAEAREEAATRDGDRSFAPDGFGRHRFSVANTLFDDAIGEFDARRGREAAAERIVTAAIETTAGGRGFATVAMHLVGGVRPEGSGEDCLAVVARIVGPAPAGAGRAGLVPSGIEAPTVRPLVLTEEVRERLRGLDDGGVVPLPVFAGASPVKAGVVHVGARAILDLARDGAVVDHAAPRGPEAALAEPRDAIRLWTRASDLAPGAGGPTSEFLRTFAAAVAQPVYAGRGADARPTGEVVRGEAGLAFMATHFRPDERPRRVRKVHLDAEAVERIVAADPSGRAQSLLQGALIQSAGREADRVAEAAARLAPRSRDAGRGR